MHILLLDDLVKWRCVLGVSDQKTKYQLGADTMRVSTNVKNSCMVWISQVLKRQYCSPARGVPVPENPDFSKSCQILWRCLHIQWIERFPPSVFIARQKPYDQYLIIYGAGKGEMLYWGCRAVTLNFAFNCWVYCWVLKINEIKKDSECHLSPWYHYWWSQGESNPRYRREIPNVLNLLTYWNDSMLHRYQKVILFSAEFIEFILTH